MFDPLQRRGRRTNAGARWRPVRRVTTALARRPRTKQDPRSRHELVPVGHAGLEAFEADFQCLEDIVAVMDCHEIQPMAHPIDQHLSPHLLKENCSVVHPSREAAAFSTWCDVQAFTANGALDLSPPEFRGAHWRHAP